MSFTDRPTIRAKGRSGVTLGGEEKMEDGRWKIHRFIAIEMIDEIARLMGSW